MRATLSNQSPSPSSYALATNYDGRVCSQSVSESAFAWPSKVSGDGENDAAPRISSARHAARGKGRRVKQGRKDCRNLTMKMLLE